MDSTLSDLSDELAMARAAALAYAAHVGLPDGQARELLGPPLFGPVDIDRDGRAVAAYRWLGSGRGAPYLQSEVDRAGATVTIHSGENHVDREPMTYRLSDLETDQPG